MRGGFPESVYPSTLRHPACACLPALANLGNPHWALGEWTGERATEPPRIPSTAIGMESLGSPREVVLRAFLGLLWVLGGMGSLQTHAMPLNERALAGLVAPPQKSSRCSDSFLYGGVRNVGRWSIEAE